MPTEFTKCDECNYIKSLGIKHKFNIDYKNSFEIFNILSTKLPNELVFKIMLQSNSKIKMCDYCNNTKLCEQHYKRAIKFGEHYRGAGAMCDSCCWWEVT